MMQGKNMGQKSPPPPQHCPWSIIPSALQFRLCDQSLWKKFPFSFGSISQKKQTMMPKWWAAKSKTDSPSFSFISLQTNKTGYNGSLLTLFILWILEHGPFFIEFHSFFYGHKFCWAQWNLVFRTRKFLTMQRYLQCFCWNINLKVDAEQVRNKCPL